MDKCRVKKSFVLKTPEHGRDHSDMILTRYSDQVFYYPAQNRRVMLMMDFHHGHPKYDPLNYYLYKAPIGSISIEEFNEHFECL